MPKKIGKTSVKNKVGRPLLFKTVKELQDSIDEYFEWCDNRTKKVWMEKTQSESLVSDPAPYTMSGLARRLGLDRHGLLNYVERDEFYATIKQARERVHEDVETRLMDGRVQTGAIFNLKNNFGWKDERSNDLTSKGDKLEPTQILIIEDKQQDE